MITYEFYSKLEILEIAALIEDAIDSSLLTLNDENYNVSNKLTSIEVFPREKAFRYHLYYRDVRYFFDFIEAKNENNELYYKIDTKLREDNEVVKNIKLALSNNGDLYSLKNHERFLISANINIKNKNLKI